MESLVEVLFEVMNQLIMLLVGDGKIGQAVSGVFTEAKGRMRAHVEEIKQYAETADDAASQVALDYLKMDANAGGLEATKALEEMEGKLGDVGDAADSTSDSISNLTSTFSKYKDVASDKVRVDGVPIEIPRSVVNDEGQILGGQMSEGMMDGMMSQFNLQGVMSGDQMGGMFNMSGVEGAENFAEGFDAGMVEQHSEMYDTTYDAVQDGPVEALTASEQSITNATEMAIIRPINEAIFNSKDRLFNNVCYAMKGAMEGLSLYNPLVVSAMEKLATDMDEHFRKPLDENSPSKVFFKNGMYIIQGLLNGIDSNEGDARKSIADLANSIVTSFGDPLNYISKIASGELQVDPSIQPVLDTSRIQRGSAAIGTMLNGQAVTIGGLSGQIAADIGELDSRNLDVVMELRALREEMALMGEDITNMQIVMDTGALVGATAGQMDKALGQRQVRYGRGN